MILTLCGGFLMAVLWMDLMFDVQVLRHRDTTPELPEAVLSSIADYYRRVTTDARPMGYAVGIVMTSAVALLLAQIVRGNAPRWVALISFVLCAAPIALAMSRVYPNAVRLGSRVDAVAEQSALARAICRDHLVSLGSIMAFVALQLFAGPQ